MELPLTAVRELQVGWAARSYGWRWGMWVPGAVGFTVGLLLLLGVRDSPESCGYLPVEKVDSAKKVGQLLKKSQSFNSKPSIPARVHSLGPGLLSLPCFERKSCGHEREEPLRGCCHFC